MREAKSETIVLINESKRAWSFPSRPIPSERGKLDARGKRRPVTIKLPNGSEAQSLVELERVEMYRAPLLEAPDKEGRGGRIEVPAWYFDELVKIDGLRAVFNKRGGIAVGRTRAEALAERRESDLEAEVERAEAAKRQADEDRRARAAAERRAAELEAELAKRPAGGSKKLEERAEKAEGEVARLKAELAKLEERLTAPAKTEQPKG